MGLGTPPSVGGTPSITLPCVICLQACTPQDMDPRSTNPSMTPQRMQPPSITPAHFCPKKRHPHKHALQPFHHTPELQTLMTQTDAQQAHESSDQQSANRSETILSNPSDASCPCSCCSCPGLQPHCCQEAGGNEG